MSAEKIVVAYEGDDDSGKLLDYAVEYAGKVGAGLHLVHVLEWSPYKFLTPEEIEERHARRTKELTRAEDVIMTPALEKLRDKGIEATCKIQYGSVVEIIAEEAKSAGASLIIVGRAGSNSIASRVFGSVTIGLAQIAPVPTLIVP